MRRNNFTMIELLFTISILVILMSIAWVAGSKVIRSVKLKQTHTEIHLLETAIKQYRARYGKYPWGTGDLATTAFNFGEKLSKVAHINDANYTAPSGVIKGDLNGDEVTDAKDIRRMFIDYKAHGFNIQTLSGQEYSGSPETSVAAPVVVCDPYEQPYTISYTNGRITISSKGLDPDVTTDDITNRRL